MSTNNSFNYSEIEGDPTKQEILAKERFYGYDSSKPLILDYSTYRNLYNSIIHDKNIRFSEYFLGCLVSEKQLKKSVSIWDDLGIKLYEIDILDSSYGNVEEGGFILTQEFLDAIRAGHPSILPITFNRKKRGTLYGCVESISLTASSNNPEDNGILYRNVDLSRLGKKVTTCIYNHEITHTQLNSKQSCQSLLDIETVPILLEAIFAGKIDPSGDTLKKLRNSRLLEIAKYLHSYLTIPNMAYVSRIESDTYIKSILQAIQLSNIYLTGNSNIRKEIQEYINRIFLEQVSVQDMLNHYNANLDEVPKELKRLKVPR